MAEPEADGDVAVAAVELAGDASDGIKPNPEPSTSSTGMPGTEETMKRTDSAKTEGTDDVKAEGDEELDALGEGEESGEEDPDDDVDWEELYACPLTVRFTQDKIHPFFYRRGPILNVLPKIRPFVHTVREGREPVGLTPSDLERDVYELVPPFDPIHCLRKGDELWSLDNRRLYALQFAAMQWWPQRCCIRLLCSDRLERRKRKTQYRKFQTKSEGRAIHVCARFQQFESWSWFDRAVEMEVETMSGRLGSLLSVFEMLPVGGVLLYRTGLTGLGSRVPLVIGFCVAFLVDFLRRTYPTFERRVSELHVKAVMDGEVARKADGEIAMTSSPQFAAAMAMCMLLIVPYVLGLANDKLRSSLISCWLGVACVLVFQLVPSLRRSREIGAEYLGSAAVLTPKHRDTDNKHD